MIIVRLIDPNYQGKETEPHGKVNHVHTLKEQQKKYGFEFRVEEYKNVEKRSDSSDLCQAVYTQNIPGGRTLDAFRIK